MFLRTNSAKNKPGCQLLERTSGSWEQDWPACKGGIHSCMCLVRWRLNGFPVVLYVERWKGAEYSDLLGSFPFLNRNHSDDNLLRISDVSTSNIFLKHNQMFQHHSLSHAHFERYPFLVFNFFLSSLFLSHYILSYLVLSCTLFYCFVLYCVTLHCRVVYCIALYFTVLNWIVLYCIVW